MPITYNGNEIKKLLFIDSAGRTKEVKSLVLNGNPTVPVNPNTPFKLTCELSYKALYLDNEVWQSVTEVPIPLRTGLRIKNTSAVEITPVLNGQLVQTWISPGHYYDLAYPTANTQYKLELAAFNGGPQPEVGYVKSDQDTMSGARLMPPELDPRGPEYPEYAGYEIYNPNFIPVEVVMTEATTTAPPQEPLDRWNIGILESPGHFRETNVIQPGETVTIQQYSSITGNFKCKLHFVASADHTTRFGNSDSTSYIDFRRYKPPAITYKYSLDGDLNTTAANTNTDGIYIENTSNSEFFVDIKNVSSGKLIVDKKRVAPAEVNNGIDFPLPANTKFEATAYGLNYDGNPLLTEKRIIATFTTGTKFNCPDTMTDFGGNWNAYSIQNRNFHSAQIYFSNPAGFPDVSNGDYLGSVHSDNSVRGDLFTGSSGTITCHIKGNDGYSDSDNASMTFTDPAEPDPGETTSPEETAASLKNAKVVTQDGDFTLYQLK